jgi:outer membrane protein assembly factor BamB
VAIPLVSDSLVVLDARTGRVTSRSALPGGVAAPLSRVDDSTVAAASPAGWVAAVDLADGRVKWLAHTGAPVAGAPVVARDTVYVLTNECTLWAVSARDGSRGDTAAVAPPPGGAWSVPCTTAAGPALVRGGVLVATVGGDVVFYDRAARRSAWSRPARGELRHPPSVRNGQVVVAPVIGNVVSFR